MPAVATALLAGPVLACKPGDKKQGGASSLASVSPEDVKSGLKSDHVKSQNSKFRRMVLEQFDANGNGRLDSKERAAANKALSAKDGGADIEALREQALAEFDTNHNGKLEKTEIHKALSSVNAATKKVASNDSSKQVLTADERAATTQLQQQMLYNGINTTSGQIQTLENLLANNGGTLTAAETMLIQNLLSQLAAQAATTTLTPAATTTTGTGTTGTSATGTGTGMCSGGSSGTSTGTGSSGTSTGTGTSTTSSLRNSTNQTAAGPFLSGAGGGGGFGGFGGGGGFRGGFRGR